MNKATVYIDCDKNTLNYLTSSVLAASNSDIHLNGTMSFYNNKASHGAAIDFIHYHISSFMNLLMLLS